MDQSNRKSSNKHSNFFIAPHAVFDDDRLRSALTHAERDFLIALCHLSNRYADKDGWFWHTDKSFNTRKGKERGFEAYGFSTSTCKRVRKRLAALGLIETKQDSPEHGHWPGTQYRIYPHLMSTGDHSGLRSGTTMVLRPRPP